MLRLSLVRSVQRRYGAATQQLAFSSDSTEKSAAAKKKHQPSMSDIRTAVLASMQARKSDAETNKKDDVFGWANASKPDRKGAIRKFLEATRGSVTDLFGRSASADTAKTGMTAVAANHDMQGRAPAPAWVDASKRAGVSWVDRDGNVRAPVLAKLAHSYGEDAVAKQRSDNGSMRKRSAKIMLDSTRGQSKSPAKNVPVELDRTTKRADDNDEVDAVSA